ncbi:MAG TPA: hypothetical protein VHC67_01300 [Gaiellaceae bacterium]|jgi:hypothetical protein|nr:hypothetical protein [Gaiellaceae bacterium]
MAKRHVTALLGAVVAVAALVVGITNAAATTGPDVIVNTAVTASPRTVVIARNEYARGSTARYPRGTVVHFHVKNTGKAPIRMQMRIASKLSFYGASKLAKVTKQPSPVSAGHTGAFNIFFFYRGKFVMEELVAGKVVALAHVEVF